MIEILNIHEEKKRKIAKEDIEEVRYHCFPSKTVFIDIVLQPKGSNISTVIYLKTDTDTLNDMMSEYMDNLIRKAIPGMDLEKFVDYLCQDTEE